MVRPLVVLACAAACAMSGAVSAETSLVDGPDARLLAEEIHTILSREALPPKSRSEYDAALASLRRVAVAERVEEEQLYASINGLLHTIDEDRHTQLIRKSRAEMMRQPFVPAREQAPAAYTTDDGRVLVISVPATSTQGEGNITEAANSLLDDIRKAPGAADACALVVDLSRQIGGNGWPGVVALADLITPSNSAQMTRRDGSRYPLASQEDLRYRTMKLRDENRQLLARFRTLPFGVLVTKKTSSAGEMIAILLKGEARARIFGTPTGGYTTINTTRPLSSGDLLAVSVGRYALGDAPEIRGPLRPDVALASNTPHAEALSQAGAWARSQSAACKRN